MDAKVENLDGVFLVTLKGQLDFESADSLKIQCGKLFKQKKVIFNLKELNFVGSSGLTPFLELMRDLLVVNGNAFKICSVGREFMRLFEAGELNGLEVYENASQARMAYDYRPLQASVATPTPVAEAEVYDKVQSFGMDIKIEE